jgi:hypothetical protein
VNFGDKFIRLRDDHRAGLERFAASSVLRKFTPVRLPPGRARLLTSLRREKDRPTFRVAPLLKTTTESAQAIAHGFNRSGINKTITGRRRC